MVLKDKYNNKSYCCKFTEELDRCAGFDKKAYKYYEHYLLDYRNVDGFHNYPIRVPGGTVGGIWVDEHNVIADIKIDRNYVVKTYSDNLNKIIQKYIGEKIEFEVK